MQTAVDIFTVIGSIVAIITGAFVIWERLFRFAPAAYVIAQSPIPARGASKRLYLKVVNRSDRPILLAWPRGSQPDVMRLTLNHSTFEIVRSLLDGELAVAIDGKSENLFPIMTPPNWGDLDLDQTIEIVVKWRFAQPVFWKGERSFTVRISKRSSLVLLDEVQGDDEEG